MTEEEVYALVMGPSGKHLYQLRQKTQKEFDGLDMKNPSPQAVARAAKGLSEMLDTFINCITIRALLANLESAAKTLGSATPYEIVEIQLQIARAKAWLDANCKSMK